MLDKNKILGLLPLALRDELLEEYNKLVKNFRESRWEPAELDGGRLSEVIYSIIRGHVDGKFPLTSYKPNDFVTACRDMEKADSTKFPRSVRILIPRCLMFLYDIRNNRGVGHVGGEVNSNEMDSSCVVACAKWLLAELIRIFHNVTTAIATQAVEAVTTRESPLVWVVGDQKRVMSTRLKAKDAVLVLLHQTLGDKATAVDLQGWVEYTNTTDFKKTVLKPLHKQRLLEYSETANTVTISPTGIAYVEKDLIPRL